MEEDPKCTACGEGQNGGCGNDGCGSGQAEKGPEKLPENDLSRIKNVIAIMSGKGGVGKSSVTSLLASEFHKKGSRVGVLDADITGPSLPKMFGIKGMAEGTDFGLLPSKSATGIKIMSLNLLTPVEDDPVIWRGPILASVVKQFWSDVAWGELDYLFVDLPPGTGDVPLTVMQSLPLNGLIVVTSPQELAAMIVRKAIKMAMHMAIPILGLVENMTSAVCPHCGEKFALFGPGHGKEIAEKFNIPFLGGIPVDPYLAELCDHGKVEEYNSNLFVNLLSEQLNH
jgi:Mrp family chromosome partitioning ATPase